MGFMSFFRNWQKPIETRSSGTGYTAQVMQARASYIGGTAGLGELTAAVQSCVTLWEGGLALADVKGTDLLSRRALAMGGADCKGKNRPNRSQMRRDFFAGERPAFKKS